MNCFGTAFSACRNITSMGSSVYGKVSNQTGFLWNSLRKDGVTVFVVKGINCMANSIIEGLRLGIEFTVSIPSHLRDNPNFAFTFIASISLLAFKLSDKFANACERKLLTKVDIESQTENNFETNKEIDLESQTENNFETNEEIDLESQTENNFETDVFDDDRRESKILNYALFAVSFSAQSFIFKTMIGYTKFTNWQILALTVAACIVRNQILTEASEEYYVHPAPKYSPMQIN